jgi:ferritin
MTPLTQELITALNDQMTTEYNNCAFYWAVERGFREAGWCGMANWAHEAASEERHHAKKISKYMIERGAQPAPGGMSAPPSFYTIAVRDVFQNAADKEADTTRQLVELYSKAADGEDSDLCNLLYWFLNEQREIEWFLATVLKKLTFADDEAAAIMMLDKDLGKKARKMGR